MYPCRPLANSETSKISYALRRCLGILLLLSTTWAYGYGSMMGGGMMGGYTTAPQVNTNDNDPGAKLFQQDCSQCHALPSPLAHSADQWSAVIERMRAHLRQYGGRDLSDEETKAILGYLKKHAQH